jgi:hypothetical protein
VLSTPPAFVLSQNQTLHKSKTVTTTKGRNQNKKERSKQKNSKTNIHTQRGSGAEKIGIQ